MARKIKVKPAQQQTVLSKELAVLRKINFAKMNPNIAEIVALTQLEPEVAESEMAWFQSGYISNGHPRSSDVAEEIMATTTGFAVGRTDTGEILQEFTGADALMRAERAVAGAKVKLAIDVDLDEEEEEIEVEPFEAEPQVDEDPSEGLVAAADEA